MRIENQLTSFSLTSLGNVSSVVLRGCSTCFFITDNMLYLARRYNGALFRQYSSRAASVSSPRPSRVALASRRLHTTVPLADSPLSSLDE